MDRNPFFDPTSSHNVELMNSINLKILYILPCESESNFAEKIWLVAKSFMKEASKFKKAVLLDELWKITNSKHKEIQSQKIRFLSKMREELIYISKENEERIVDI